MTTIYGKLIKDSYIFCRTERDFIRQLCLQLKHRTYFPGDYIVRDGDVDSCMYFIHRGDVRVVWRARNKPILYCPTLNITGANLNDRPNRKRDRARDTP